jgi:hypothetical protein
MHPPHSGLFSTENLSTVFSGKGWGIFVVDLDQNLYIHKHIEGKYHHSTFQRRGGVRGRRDRGGGRLGACDHGQKRALYANGGKHAAPCADLSADSGECGDPSRFRRHSRWRSGKMLLCGRFSPRRNRRRDFEPSPDYAGNSCVRSGCGGSEVDQPGPGVSNPGDSCRRRQPHSRLTREAVSDTIRAIGLLAPPRDLPAGQGPCLFTSRKPRFGVSAGGFHGPLRHQ